MTQAYLGEKDAKLGMMRWVGADTGSSGQPN